MAITRYILRRLIQLIPTLIGITLVVFLLLRIIPGDPAKLMAGEEASREVVERIRKEMGLDKPVPMQFVDFVARAVQGDFGRSHRTGKLVLEEIVTRYPITIRVAVAGTVLAVLIGVLAGIISAVRQYSLIDGVSMILALLGVSTPSFWLGLMLMLVFALWLRWLPAIGHATPKHYILPAITLGAQAAGIIARMTRSAMLEVVRQDYIRTARAKGLGERAVIYGHALKNAAIPVITVVGLQFGYLLAGAVLVESVFNMPGVGRMLVEAVAWRDYPMVQGAVLIVAASFVLVNLVVDLTYGFVDPRIHYE